MAEATQLAIPLPGGPLPGSAEERALAEALAERYPEPTTSNPGHDALEAFIGSGDSGRSEPFDIHKARAELAERKFAEGI